MWLFCSPSNRILKHECFKFCKIWEGNLKIYKDYILCTKTQNTYCLRIVTDIARQVKRNLISRTNPTDILQHCGLAHCEMASALLGLECNRCSHKSLEEKASIAPREKTHIELPAQRFECRWNINVLPLVTMRSWRKRSAKINSLYIYMQITSKYAAYRNVFI